MKQESFMFLHCIATIQKGRMNSNLVVIVFGVICLTAVQPSPVPQVDVAINSEVEEKVPLILHAYSLGNESDGSTFEEIMQEIANRIEYIDVPISTHH